MIESSSRMEKRRLGRLSPFPRPESWSQNVDPRIPNLEAACCPSPGPGLRAPPPPAPPPPSPQSQLASAAESHLCLSPRDINTQPGTPWGWGPSRYSENSQAAAQRALGWVSARGMARGGHLAFQIPPGPSVGPDKCPALLISPTPSPALPQTCVHSGVHSSLEIRGGTPTACPPDS